MKRLTIALVIPTALVSIIACNSLSIKSGPTQSATKALSGGDVKVTSTPILTPSPTVVAVVDTPTEVTTNRVSLCANDYYPTVKGAWWVLLRTDRNPGSVLIGNYVHWEIIDVRDNEFSTAFETTDTDQFTPLVHVDPASVIDFKCLPDGISFMNSNDIWIPKEMTPGFEWKTGEGKKYEITNKIVGFETITVPAGTFNAIRIEQVISNIPGPISIWYAKGVGEIKDEVLDENGNTLVKKELVSYSIPK